MWDVVVKLGKAYAILYNKVPGQMQLEEQLEDEWNIFDTSTLSYACRI